MEEQDRSLFELRLQYSRSEAFAAERGALWAQIQEMEEGMDPAVVRGIIEAVIFAPEPEDQLELPLMG